MGQPEGAGMGPGLGHWRRRIVAAVMALKVAKCVKSAHYAPHSVYFLTHFGAETAFPLTPTLSLTG
jgi:hypothetical protein